MTEVTRVRVLLVEDEGGIALLLEDMLEELGCEIVASVARISGALDVAASQAFDLAVLDVNVAGETSFDLARLLLERGTPFVFSTGYGATGLPADLASCPVLSKPFTLENLRQKIRECMGPGGG
ncbi:response regulator [Brevundimonas sp.]|uniref:response regulator n=1 Tax=Brevundimonas sp. TaxID=1871086 RepID=UPI002D6F4123|nr:response regulator [Brevundimonas sp.]HYC97459.1 response regulator [Brevundimonas sp.]